MGRCCRLEPTQLLYLRSEVRTAPVGARHAQREADSAQPMALLAQAQEHGAEPLAPTHMYSVRLTQSQVRDELPPVPPAHAGPKMRGLLHLVQLLVHTAEPLVHGTMGLTQSAEPQLQLGAALLVTTRRSATEQCGAQRAAAGRERRLWELCAELQARDELQPMPHTVLPVQALEPKVQSVQPWEHVAQPLVHDTEELAQGAEQLLEHVAWQVQRRQTHEIELLVRAVTAQLGMPSAATTQHGKPLERGSQWRTPRAKLQVSDELKTTQLVKLRAEPHPHGELKGLRHLAPPTHDAVQKVQGPLQLVQPLEHDSEELAQSAERLAERRRTGRQTHKNELLTYGAEPQVQPLAQPDPQLLVQAQKHGAEPQRGADGQRNSQPMAVQWGTQLDAFAEELAAVQRG
ncbi:hypothetical protein CYMTET_32857 [Cymbomonas tetramitiformis]|uniref:Uncharacterized protein n=1 Tax=Cymbomonas tetramitiformis TaxID=36881 RepID=A0AAE0FDZ7_9CHLO|nr:hypothetical protein CYMTET_32857 [Cymbomonas tetramitiformis]